MNADLVYRAARRAAETAADAATAVRQRHYGLAQDLLRQARTQIAAVDKQVTALQEQPPEPMPTEPEEEDGGTP